MPASSSSKLVESPPPTPPATAAGGLPPASVTARNNAASPTGIGAPSSQPALEGEIAELVEVAQQVRSLGDLQGALEVLRKADLKSPDHPAVLSEMAQTYDQMGLTDKALASWKKVEAMGVNAGEYRLQASKRLGGAPAGGSASLSPATGLTTPETKPVDPAKTLALGTCEVIRDPAVSRGERLALRIPIRSQPAAAIDPNAIDVDVFYFDLVNDEKVEQTKADTVPAWVNAPVDWKDGLELLDVGYFLPEMTPDEIRNNGRRKFHGYIVKLYYQHKLQDTAAQPASLLNLGSGEPPQDASNPLLPPLAR